MSTSVPTGPTMTELGQGSQRVLHDFGDGPSLATSTCTLCGHVMYPPRPLCVKDLGSTVLTPASTRGRVVVAVPLHRPPYGFDGTLWVGYVDLPEGVRVFAQFADVDDSVPAGSEVALSIETVRTEPEPRQGPVYRPVIPVGAGDAHAG